MIRHQLHEDYRRKLIARMHESDMPSRHRCPACDQTMRVLGFDIEDEPIELDLCRTCSLVWFDQGELEAAPPAGPTKEQQREAERTPEQRIALANAEARLAFAAAERDQQLEGPTAATTLPAIFGLPVEIGGNQSSVQPWGTWILAVLVTAVTAAAFTDDQLLQTLALVPNDVVDRPQTLLTAFFVHGDWPHLIGNLWFFVVFGDNIEQHYGRARWLLLVVLATLAGSLMHILVDPSDTIPCVGASGGISGLIMCYALTLPRARIACSCLAATRCDTR